MITFLDLGFHGRMTNQIFQYAALRLVDPDVKMGTFYSGSKLKIKDAKKIDSLYHWWPYAVRYQMPIDLVKILIEIEIPPDVQDKLQRYKWEFGKREFFKAS